LTEYASRKWEFRLLASHEGTKRVASLTRTVIDVLYYVLHALFTSERALYVFDRDRNNRHCL